MTEKLVFCWVGKTSAPYARVGETEYLSRIARYRACKIVHVAEERSAKRYTAEHRLEREAVRLLARLDDLRPAYVAALDPRGSEMSTRDFAALVQRQCFEDTRRLVFVVGGPDGLSSSVRQGADRLLGLSRMTLPHDMARLVLLEQVYRAMTIVNGHPYDR